MFSSEFEFVPMKKKITVKIAGKIGLGFGVLTLAVIINTFVFNDVLRKSRILNKNTSTIYQPSEEYLLHLHDLVNNSQMLIKSWVFVDKVADTPDKLKLKRLHSEFYPLLKRGLNGIVDQWDESDRKEYQNVINKTDSLFVLHHSITSQLNNLSAYDDPGILFLIIPMVSDNGLVIKKTNHILNKLEKLISNQKLKITQAREEMDKAFSQLQKIVITTCIVLVLVALLLAFITVRSLVVPINYVKNTLLSMSKGILPSEKIKEKGDEIGEMSKALNQLVSGLKALSGFALEIGRGNYNSEFKPLSDDDVLGNSLIRMCDDLKAAAIEEAKRKQEDEQRNWATTGIAKFSDILRHDNDKLDVLSHNVISNLVVYMDANQGGIFLINDNDKSDVFIELVACYAFNRKKVLEKRIGINEGLIGRCIQEKETIYLSDVPANYIRINSGLGDANPRCLVLVPLVMNEKVFGVIEIASFNEIPPYQVEFVEKIAEIIASTLSTVIINVQTARLLDQSRIQAEELATKEEEMRQNMEEMRATQEQSVRKERELLNALEEIQKKMDGKR
jgi:GAF domain-containing protein